MRQSQSTDESKINHVHRPHDPRFGVKPPEESFSIEMVNGLKNHQRFCIMTLQYKSHSEKVFLNQKVYANLSLTS